MTIEFVTEAKRRNVQRGVTLLQNTYRWMRARLQWHLVHETIDRRRRRRSILKAPTGCALFQGIDMLHRHFIAILPGSSQGFNRIFCNVCNVSAYPHIHFDALWKILLKSCSATIIHKFVSNGFKKNKTLWKSAVSCWSFNIFRRFFCVIGLHKEKNVYKYLKVVSYFNGISVFALF